MFMIDSDVYWYTLLQHKQVGMRSVSLILRTVL